MNEDARRERSAALTDSAQATLEKMLDTQGIVIPFDAMTIARMMWLDGYREGMDAVQTLADESFRKLQAELS